VAEPPKKKKLKTPPPPPLIINKKTLWRLIDVYIYLYSGSIPVIGS